jgi:hypothetical protein
MPPTVVIYSLSPLITMRIGGASAFICSEIMDAKPFGLLLLLLGELEPALELLLLRQRQQGVLELLVVVHYRLPAGPGRERWVAPMAATLGSWCWCRNTGTNRRRMAARWGRCTPPTHRPSPVGTRTSLDTHASLTPRTPSAPTLLALLVIYVIVVEAFEVGHDALPPSIVLSLEPPLPKR